MLVQEEVVDAPDSRYFLVGTGYEDDALKLEAFAFSLCEDGFRLAVLIQQKAPQTVPGRAALPKAERNKSALSGEDFGAELPAVFAGHRPLEALHDGPHRSVVGRELLGAI